MRRLRLRLALAAMSLTTALTAAMTAGCSKRAPLPPQAPTAASVGRCGAPVDAARLCGEWSDAVAACHGDASVHDSLPELSSASCFVPVTHEPGRLPRAGEVPEGCGYPAPGEVGLADRLREEASRYVAVASGEAARLPMVLDCGLDDEVRRAAADHNAKVFAALADRFAESGGDLDGDGKGQGGRERHAYAAVSTFGFGAPAMRASPVASWRPGDACIPLDKREMDRLSVNVQRAGLAAASYHGGVAPVITASGAAVRSAPVVEAFMLLHLLRCRFDVPEEAVLLDPCADHTHTNLRNTGALLRALGGRHGYVITDDGLQGGYLQEWSAFWLIGGTIDQRSLRDWGYLLGAWRQASRGYDAGFWFTPYRFWGEPADGLGGIACVE